MEKNPIPMCNCDIGIGCEGSKDLSVDEKVPRYHSGTVWSKDRLQHVPEMWNFIVVRLRNAVLDWKRLRRMDTATVFRKHRRRVQTTIPACFRTTYPETYTNGEKYERCLPDSCFLLRGTTDTDKVKRVSSCSR